MANHMRNSNARWAEETPCWGDQATSRRRKRVWPRVVIGLLAVLLVFGCVEGVLLFSSVSEVKAQAQTAMEAAGSFAEGARTGNTELISSSAEEVSKSAHAMQNELSSVPWVVASYIPVVGSDVRSVRTMGDVMADLCDEALDPMAQNASLLSLSSLMGDSTVNMDAVKNLSAVVEQVSPVVQRSAQTMEELPPAVIPQVSTVLEKARQTIVGAGNAASYITPLLPDLPMLLGDGGQQRNYLIVASNTSELHALGGFVGQVGVLSVTDGVFSLGEFQNTMTQLPTNSVSAGATEEEIRVFGERADTHHGDHNIIPDFSRVGQLYYNIWEIAQNQQLDGVIGVDPIFLQRMLGLTGGVDTSFGVFVDGTNAASVIMNECLFWWEPKVCDEFYKEVASASFSKLLHGLSSVDLFELAQVIVQSADESRAMAWVRDESAQQHMLDSGLGGQLAHDATAPVVGVYASDCSTTKAAYYLSLDTEVGAASQNSDGSTSYQVTAVFRHNMDRSILDGDYPTYLHSDAPDKSKQRSTSELIEQVRIIAPEGGKIEDVKSVFSNSTLPPRDMNWGSDSYQGLQTWMCDMYLDVAETCTITFKVTTSPEATEALQVRCTPVVPHEIRGD